MISVARRGLQALAALAGGGALIAAGLAGSASAATGAHQAAASDPTITIRVGGIRTAENGPPGPAAAAGLNGVTYRATASGFTAVSCTSVTVAGVAGICT